MPNSGCKIDQRFPTVFSSSEIQSRRDWAKKNWPKYLEIERKTNRRKLSPEDLETYRANAQNPSGTPTPQ